MFLAAACTAYAHGLQGNAVAGSVCTMDDCQPLAGVMVKLVQKQDINDTTRKNDGLYTLAVPPSIKKFDLVFEHPNYLKAFDRGILNEQKQNKRAPVKMTAKNMQAIIALPVGELDRIITEAKAADLEGALDGMRALAEAGKANLAYLLEVTQALNQSALQKLTSARPLKSSTDATARSLFVTSMNDAEQLLKRALAIRERIEGPTSLGVAEILTSYSYVLMEKDDRVGAMELERRASIRERANMSQFERAMIGERTAMMAEPATVSPTRPGFLFDNAEPLPSFTNAIVPVVEEGSQYGKVAVAAGDSAGFRVFIERTAYISITVVNRAPAQIELAVFDINNRPIQTQSDSQNRVTTWRADGPHYFTVKVTNKSSTPFVYALRISGSIR